MIDRRLLRLEGLVRRLERDGAVSLEQYLADEDLEAQVERRLQLAAQVCLDVANYLIARGDLEIPEQEENVFTVLASAGVLPAELAKRLRGLTRFRNILVHDYLSIDNEIVYRTLQAGLHDLREFARAVVRHVTSQE